MRCSNSPPCATKRQRPPRDSRRSSSTTPTSPTSATTLNSWLYLHRGEHVVRAQHQLRDLIRDLLIEGAKTGELRDDVASDELATYCLHALTAAGNLPSKAAVQRLLDVTLSGLRRQ